MQLKYKRKLVIIGTILAILISSSCFFLGFVNSLHPKLGMFEIEKVEELNNLLYMYTTKSHNAKYYQVIGYDEYENIVYEKSSKSNKILLDELYLNYRESVSFEVYAYNKKEEKLKSENDYKYTSLDLSFSDNLEHFTVKNNDYNVSFLGDYENAKYTLDLNYEGRKIKTLSIKSENVVIPKELINDLSGKITLKLIKNDKRVINTFNLYANSPVVGNISITNLPISSNIRWDDLNINYEGGVNATRLVVNLYHEGRLENSFETAYTIDGITLPATFFGEGKNYTLELMAVYKDYLEIAKKSQVIIEVGNKETVKPVYTNYNPTNIKNGTKISLKTNTEDAIIYYTVDGSEPTLASLIYTGSIPINEDVTIKTKAIRKNMYDSVTNIYDFHVGEKNLVVYLSPSNQYTNYGIKGSGYTNEKAMMNKLTDYLEDYLKSYGVKVYRNNPSSDINVWISESNYVKSDLHFAIHSNGSQNHSAHGIEIYVDNETSKSLSIANKIYNNLYSIYPYKDEYSNRGVKYSGKSLGEANDLFIKCGTLIEVAYHDYYEDAVWMVENLNLIAENIGNSVLEYYQVK